MSEDQLFTTTIVGQPDNYPAGFELEVGTLTPTVPDLSPDHIHVFSELGASKGAVLLIAAVRGDDLLPWGTASLIAPGIAVTATHVIDEYRQFYTNSSEIELMALGVVDNTLQVWNVQRISTINLREIGSNHEFRSEICLLSIDHTSQSADQRITFSVFQPSWGMPRTGDVVFAFSIRSNQITNTYPEELNANLLISRGTVQEAFPQGRDRRNLPGPCFSTDMLAIGGMSGGPVFNSDGKLIAVVSSSMIFDDETGIIYCSVVGPSQHVNCEPYWPPNFYPHPEMTLQEIIAHLLAFRQGTETT